MYGEAIMNMMSQPALEWFSRLWELLVLVHVAHGGTVAAQEQAAQRNK